MKIFIILFILILIFFISSSYKEGFLSTRCTQYSTCRDCAKASGCSWCPKESVCLSSTSLKSTDKNCNQSNTITSDFRCSTLLNDTLPEENTAIQEQYDFTLYKDKIKNRIPPPNAYESGKVEYSSADLTSNMNQIRNTISNLAIELPGIISSSVENEIKPMVKGVISNVQGFTDYSKECNKRNTCYDCTDSTLCGWDPLSLKCTERSPNRTQYITQKQRCVITPSTLNLMRAQPN